MKKLKKLIDLKFGDIVYAVRDSGLTTQVIKGIQEKQIKIGDTSVEISITDDSTSFKSPYGAIYYLNKIEALIAQEKHYEKMLETMIAEREDFIVKLTAHYHKIRVNDKDILEERNNNEFTINFDLDTNG